MGVAALTPWAGQAVGVDVEVATGATIRTVVSLGVATMGGGLIIGPTGVAPGVGSGVVTINGNFLELRICQVRW